MKFITTKKPRQAIKTESDVLDFGKYKNCTIEDVMHDDPQYILWLDDESIVEFPVHITDKAHEYAGDADEVPYGMSWGDWKD